MLTTDEMEREAYQRGDMDLAGVLAQVADAEESAALDAKESEETHDALQKELDDANARIADLEAALKKAQDILDRVDNKSRKAELMQCVILAWDELQVSA